MLPKYVHVTPINISTSASILIENVGSSKIELVVNWCIMKLMFKFMLKLNCHQNLQANNPNQ